ncbi:hypothetical protein [Bradyrhizobium elkanii]|uniref:hypothetical protein n=1 Tax=Bradyrhizobium elkanii TaxID=29448 RepID=UPI0004051DEE|nr:hypothetical protein [Bradyrhizobium elkanii]
MRLIIATVAAVIALSGASHAQSDSIWASVPIPVLPKHTKPPELPIFDPRSTSLAILAAPLIVNGSIWPDPEIIKIPMRPQMVCSSGNMSRCYTISPSLR